MILACYVSARYTEFTWVPLGVQEFACGCHGCGWVLQTYSAVVGKCCIYVEHTKHLRDYGPCTVDL